MKLKKKIKVNHHMTVNWKKQLEVIVAKFSADVGIIHRFDHKSKSLVLLANTDGFPKSLIESVKRIPIGQGTLAAITVLEKKSIIMNNLATNPSELILPEERTLNIKGIITVPVFYGEEVVGCLGMGCYNERLFTQQEIDALIEEGKKIASLIISKQ